jgi:hypothetical protein
MGKMFIAGVVAAVLVAPAPVDAYGAAHVGYTHVGPSGVQHYGQTAHRGPNSSGYVAHRSAAGANGAYHGGEAYHTGGAAAGGYHNTGATAAGGSYHYAYVR